MPITLDQVRERMVHAWDGVERFTATAIEKAYPNSKGKRPRFLPKTICDLLHTIMRPGGKHRPRGVMTARSQRVHRPIRR